MFGRKALKESIKDLRSQIRELKAVNKSLQWQIINPPKYQVGNKHCCHGECVDVFAVQSVTHRPYDCPKYKHHWRYTFKNEGQTIIVE